MNAAQRYAWGRWFCLPALDADPGRLPAGYAAGAPRAVRLASATLLGPAWGFPAGAPDGAWRLCAGSMAACRRRFGMAGARFHSGQLRRRAGDALAASLVRELGAEEWKRCLHWADGGEDAEHRLDAGADYAQVAATGAALVCAYLRGLCPGLLARLLCRFPRQETETWMAWAGALADESCRRIAEYVLEQE